MMNRIPSKSFILIPILLVVFALFYPNLSAAFTNWDDQIHITENKRVQTLTWESVGELFKPNNDYMYHPLTMFTYAVEWHIGNGSPAVFHLFSLLLHLINIILVYRIIMRISDDQGTALIVSFLFGIHPVNVETVSWISARKDLLYSFFVLGGLDLYFRYLEGKNRIGTYIGIVLMFLLGLLSKPTMVVFPLFLLLIDWWRNRPFNRTVILEKLPFVVIAFVFGLFTIMLSKSSVDNETIMSLYKYQHKILLVCYAAVFYAGKLLVPVDLSALYHYPLVVSGALPVIYYFAPIIVALMISAAILAGRKWRFVLLSAALYSIPLLLVLQILPFNNTSLVSDRYAYLSSIGIMFLAVTGIKKFLRSASEPDPFWNSAAAMMLVIVTVMFMVGTMARISVWRDSIRVFTSVLENDNTVWIAYANRAIEKIKQEDYDGAMQDVSTALVIHPKRKSLYGVRGNIYFYRKEYEKALADFDSVTFSSKAKPYDFYNKAASLYYLQRYDSAEAYYSKTLRADSTIGRAYHGYGMILLTARENPESAIRCFDSAISFDASLWEAYYYRAVAQRMLGNAGAAMRDLSSALVRNPKIAQDTLITQVNELISSLSAKINSVKKDIDEGDRRSDLYNELSRTYLMLGDSIRSRNASAMVHHAKNERLR